MIENSAIKKFVIDYFIEHSQEDINEMTMKVHGYLLRNFVVNEVVFSKRLELAGRIIKVLKSGYILLIYSDNGNYEDSFQFSDLMRRDDITTGRIKEYIIGITMETPFGRVLKENAFGSIKSSANILKCKAPMNQRCDRQLTSSFKPQASAVKIKEIKEAEPLLKRKGKLHDQETKRSRDGKAERMVSEPRYERELARQKKMMEKKERKEGRKIEERPAEIEAILKLTYDRRMKVDGFELHRLESLMKIFSFLSNFKSFFKIKKVSLEELAASILDPAYESSIIFKIHSRLVEVLISEIDNTGMEDFAENVKPALMLVEELASLRKTERNKKSKSSEDEGSQKTKQAPGLKANAEFTEKNWKPNVKLFVFELSENVNENISIFADSVSKKKNPLNEEQLETRLAFIEFLLNSFFVTDVFRDMISEKMAALKDLEKKKKEAQAKLKNTKLLIRRSADTDSPEDLLKQKVAVEKDLMGITGKILQSPLKVEMGSADEICFLNIDKKIYAIKDGVYYSLTKDMLLSLYKHYTSKNKAEKNVLSSLMQHAEILQS